MEVGKHVLDIAITILLKLYAPIQASEPQIPTSLEIPSTKHYGIFSISNPTN
jgi:hypothetical protein